MVPRRSFDLGWRHPQLQQLRARSKRVTWALHRRQPPPPRRRGERLEARLTPHCLGQGERLGPEAGYLLEMV